MDMVYGVTDIGSHRRDNQDAIYTAATSHRTVCVVCDGMGGAQAGDVASTMAVEAFSHGVEDRFPPEGTPREEVAIWMRAMCQEVNQLVYTQSQSSPHYEGMGTTLVAAVVQGGVAHIVNVGDSRCYRLTSQGMTQVTHDHSLVQMLLDRGQITPQEAKVHPQRNLITKVLGVYPQVCADYFCVPCEQGDRLLLCSDGLTNAVEEEQVYPLAWEASTVQEGATQLLEQALTNHAQDNVTIGLLQVGQEQGGT